MSGVFWQRSTPKEVCRGVTDWDDILQRHGPRVWRMAHRLLGNPDDADECLQEVFLTAWEYERTRPIRHWPAFLQTILTNKALDKLRRRARCPDPAGCRIVDPALVSSGPTPEQQAQAAELADRLSEAISRLSAEDAQVFCLCCLDSFDHREVAETLGISVAAVGTRLHRARNRLRDMLIPAAERRSRTEE